ncbi:hypothetical protein CK203_080547 [Vitis vinifera]|uniref:Uncharacterized protein n=1 Tax=Vitis vinifera TaxID=29760 RepID=A0A438D9J9_VITVI|nr:hypothetical protein CK203_080547 [Vitis vinifera]
MPKLVVKRLEKLQRDFLWEGEVWKERFINQLGGGVYPKGEWGPRFFLEKGGWGEVWRLGFGWRTKEARGTFGVGVWRDILKESSWCWDNIEFKVGKGTKSKGTPRRAAALLRDLRTSLEEDAVIWKGESHGLFRIRDAYKLWQGLMSLASRKRHLGG